ncbi:MAG TPA: hypothetical protein DHV15_10600 [Treponema sp.]|uniref:Uncharacterized protein n=1 Tax=Treponema denticola (strain ATCC 35405 / DSM 14222 / CIP 103919 / JCM 8153 / KCTC 15104) TaxID=243275 RepID=Q73LJ0_TREDE|nr:hypothetical protein TDE_1872 [Treponema denticola ATCC 35405]HCY95935.1 hypothetical protein [Treponema sp.]
MLNKIEIFINFVNLRLMGEILYDRLKLDIEGKYKLKEIIL